MVSFRAKVSKYGDRLLETIESTIREYSKTDKNSSSNDSTDSTKRRRDANKALNGNVGEDDDFTKSTGRSKKRASLGPNKDAKVYNSREMDCYNQCLDDDLDFDDSCHDLETNGPELKVEQDGEGRVLPSWSTPGNKVISSNHNVFQEYAMNS